DRDWTPVGIAMQADPSVGETAGGLQAPFVLKVGAMYHLFYGDWENICHATSSDGKTFTRVLNSDGKSAIFTEGPQSSSRDPMVLFANGRYYAYYTAFANGQGADYVRTSSDLKTWSSSSIAAAGGAITGDGFGSAECPFVLHRPDQGTYFL